MTHMAPMADSDGEFSEYMKVNDWPCRKCDSKEQLFYREWESSCGGYEDYHYKCRACGHSWWVDGIDA